MARGKEEGMSKGNNRSVRTERENHVEISGDRFKGLKTAVETRPIDQREKNDELPKIFFLNVNE